MLTNSPTPDPAGSTLMRRRRNNRTNLAGPGALLRIVSMHGAGASAHTAAAALNGGGSRTADGMRWTARTVTDVIAEEARGTATSDAARDRDQRAAREVLDIGELGQAITTGQLEVHYQPVVDIVSGDVASVEALVRWRHPSRGLVPPGEFIPLAESCGLITELTEFVLHTVLDQTVTWKQAGRPLCCAINLSSSSLRDPRSSARLLALLRGRAGQVTVEVTESVLADDHVVAVIRELASYGVAVAVDDFGTGYSCLSAIKDLPVSTLKIDRSFLSELDGDDRAAAVVRAIVQLAEGLEMDIIAEGVETEAVAAMLRDWGVRKAQGFLYAHPMPAAELAAWLTTRATGSN